MTVTEDRLEFLRQNRGILSRLARELGVSRQHVRYVWLGERESPRVEAAIAAAMAKGEDE